MGYGRYREWWSVTHPRRRLPTVGFIIFSTISVSSCSLDEEQGEALEDEARSIVRNGSLDKLQRHATNDMFDLYIIQAFATL